MKKNRTEKDITRELAYIYVKTLEGKTIEKIPVTELDHINSKDYLSDVYHAVNVAIRNQGFTI